MKNILKIGLGILIFLITALGVLAEDPNDMTELTFFGDYDHPTGINLDHKAFEGDCFTFEDEKLCFESDLSAEFYYKEVPDGIKFGWLVNDNQGQSEFIITANKNIVDLEKLILDLSDFNNAGLSYTINGSTITIHNPNQTNWWFDPLVTISDKSDATNDPNQRHIVQTSNGDIYVVYTKYHPSSDRYSLSLGKSTNKGKTWTDFNITDFNRANPPSPITNSLSRASMVVDSDDVLHIAWKREHPASIRHDMDYTQWNTTTDSLVGGIVKLVDSTGANNVNDIDIAILDSGRLGIAFEIDDFGGGYNDANIRFIDCVSNCLVLGSWSAHTTISSYVGSGNKPQRRPDIETNGTEWTIVWDGANPTFPTEEQIGYIRTTNLVFGSTEYIDGNNAVQHIFPSLIIKNNTPMVASYNLVGSDNIIQFSNRSSGTWGTWNTIFESPGASQVDPSLSTDGSKLYVSWSATNITGDPSIKCVGLSDSSDDGTTWSPATCSKESTTESTGNSNSPVLSYQFGKETEWERMLFYTFRPNSSVSYEVRFERLSLPPTLEVTASNKETLEGIDIFNVTIHEAGNQTDNHFSGTVSYYDFDDGTATDQVNNNDGTLNGVSQVSGAVRNDLGVEGNSFTFDGINDRITVADNTNLDFSGSITMAAWVNRNSIGTEQVIIEKTGSASTGWGMRFDSGDKLAFIVGDDGGVKFEVSNSLITDTTNWHHIAITYDSSTLNFYIDGVLDLSKGLVQSIPASVDILTIGTESDETDNFFNGEIDEVGIYNTILNSSQINKLYNTGLDQIIADKLFTTTNGTIITDINNGTFNITVEAENFLDEKITNYNIDIEGTDLSTELDPFMQVRVLDRFDNQLLDNYNITFNSTIFIPNANNVTHLPIRSGLINITIDKDIYFSSSLNNIDSSINLNTTIFQAVSTFNAIEKVTGVPVTNGTFSADGQSVSEDEEIFFKAGTFNVTFNKTGFINSTQEFTFTALENTTRNFTNVIDAIVNINATRIRDGVQINVFNININDNDGFSFNEIQNTTSGLITLELNKDINYTFVIESAGFPSDSITQIINKSETNITFNLDSMQVKVFDRFDNQLLDNYTVTFNAQNYTPDINNITNLPVGVGLIDINITKTDYFQSQLSNVNASEDLNTTIFQAVVRFSNAREKITLNSVVNATYAAGTQSVGENEDLFLKSGTTTINFSRATYFDDSQQFIFNPLDNITRTYDNVFNAHINFNATSAENGSAIQNFTVNLINTTGFNFTESKNTTNFSLTMDLIQDIEYAFEMDAPGFTLETKIQTIITEETNITYSLFIPNPVNLIFKDEKNDSVISGIQIDLEIIGDPFSDNFTTNTGGLNLQLAIPALYTFRFSAPNYPERFFMLNLVARSVNDITLFMLEDVAATELTINIIDEQADPLERAFIHVQKYDLVTNSYITREILQTNFNGDAKSQIELNKEFYKFLVFFPFSELKKTTEPSYIYGTTTTIPIIIGVPIAQLTENIAGVNTDLTFNNQTLNFRWEYSDLDNLFSEYCLTAFRVGSFEKTQLNETCLTTSSGTILLPITPINGSTITASAVAKDSSGRSNFIDTSTKEFMTDTTGQLGLFVILLVSLAFAFVGRWSLSMMMILLPLPLLFASLITDPSGASLIALPLWVSVSLEVLAIALAIYISKR